MCSGVISRITGSDGGIMKQSVRKRMETLAGTGDPGRRIQ